MIESRVGSSRIGSGVLASCVVGALMFACGGGGRPAAHGTAGSDGGVEGGRTAELAVSPPPSGLPPMAPMPAAGVAGSKKAKRRPDAALAACAGSSRPQAKDPTDLVKRLGEACVTASKMKPAGAMFRGQQGDREAHQENRFRAEANHCYRLYFAGDEAVKDVVVVLRDSAGDIIAESPGPAVPEEGAVCFTAPDEVSVLVGVGSGRGAWAAQVWSD
jgi:hypothetical protein